jgi:hypothetical protein
MASVVVEPVGQAPVRVVRNTFAILAFYEEGRLDSKRFGGQQFALAEQHLRSPAGKAGLQDMLRREIHMHR